MKAIAICLMTGIGLLLGYRAGHCEEPLERYIEGLKERGYFDIALEYLEKSADSGTITPELRERLDYEKAEVLLDGLKLVRDRNQRQENLDLAQTLLDGFIKDKQFHPYASMAKKKLGELLIHRAHLAFEKSKSKKVDEAESAQLVVQAREFYTQALAVLEKSRETLKEILTRLDPKSTDATVKQLRAKYEDEYLRVRLIIGIVPEELADTYPKDAPEWKANLEKAIAEYDDYSKDYRSKPIAYRARLYQARCHEKLGNEKEATTYLSDVLDQPDDPVFYDLKRDACLMGAKIWFAAEPPQYLLAIQKMFPLVEAMPPNQAREPEWLELQLWVAKAYHGFAEQMKTKADKTAEDNDQQKIAEKRAVEYLRVVTRYPSDFKKEAQDLLVEWNISRKVEQNVQEEPPKSFIEARDRADAVLADYESDKAAVESLEESLKTAPAEEKPQLEEQLKATRESVNIGPRIALDLMRAGLTLIEADTDKAALETMLYKIAFCHYSLAEYDKSLVVSEHLMTLAPNSSAAKSIGVIGVNSLLQLAAQADASSTFEVNQLRGLCETILKIYPSEPVAVKAAAAMIQLALRAGNIQEAEDYMQKVPDGTEGKDTLEMNIGYVLWATLRRSEYDVAMAKKNGSMSDQEISAEEAKNKELRVRAQAYLSLGINSLHADNIDNVAARSSLALAQLYADADKMDETIAVLENSVYGPLTLVENKHPDADSKYAADAYQTALRAYVGKFGSADDPAVVTEKARAAMSNLKSALSETENGKKRLIGIYLRMANDVKTKMKVLKTQAEIDAYQKGLIAFLDAVLKEAEDVSILVWVAGTYSNFAEAAESKNQPQAAQTNYGKAADVYAKILKVGDADAEALGAAERLEMSRRLARSLSKAGDYEQAVKIYTQVLTNKSSVVDVQVEAAETLQKWGIAAQDPNVLAQSMMGTAKYVDPKTKREANAIWGWGKISQTVIKYPQFRFRFFEARYNLAFSRFEYAKLRKDDKQMASAENDILSSYRSDPALGGEEWTAKFNQLLKTIQTAQGKAAVGLPK